MGGKGSGFDSMAKGRLKDVAAKGGKKSAATRGNKYNSITASAASKKGVQARLKRMAVEAYDRLLNLGYDADDLAKLMLTDAEVIYYGGRTSRAFRRVELKKRIDEVTG